jgi:hypothetical protein
MPRSRKRGRRDAARPAATQTRPASSASGEATPAVKSPTAVKAPATVEAPAAVKAPPARQPRPTNEEFLLRYQARADQRNAEARDNLQPLEPGEHPWPLLLAIALTSLSGISTAILYFAGVTIGGKHSPSVLIYTVIMLICAAGMWKLWYQAVLAFMVLLAIVIVFFSLFLVEASNILGLVVALAIIGGGGFLFWKLVRVLSRLQMPQRTQRT